MRDKTIAVLAWICVCLTAVNASFDGETDFVDVVAPTASVEYDRWLPGSSARGVYCMPNEIFRRIAYMSGNRLGLSATCRTLRDFNYVAQQNITLTLPQGFHALPVFKLIMAGKYKFRWASDVVKIDAYQCNLMDLKELGFMWPEVPHKWERRLYIKKSGFTETFSSVNEIRICKIDDDWEKFYSEELYTIFGSLSVKLIEDKYNEDFHELFNLFYFNGRRLRLLWDLYAHRENLGFGKGFRAHEKRIVRFGRDLRSALLPKKEYIFNVLDHYESFKLLRNDLGDKTKSDIQQVLVLNLHNPHIIALIMKLHETRLCDFEWLFDLLAHRSEKEIHALCHDQTDEMLSLLRSFIPDYGPEFLENGRVKFKAIWLIVLPKNLEDQILQKFSFRGGNVLGSEFSETCTNNLTRNEVFYEIACALADIERGKQYALLSRLIPLLTFNELGQSIWTPRFEHTRGLTALFRHGLELTERHLLKLSDEQYDHFAVYVKVHLPNRNKTFNILEATDRELKSVLAASRGENCVVQ